MYKVDSCILTLCHSVFPPVEIQIQYFNMQDKSNVSGLTQLNLVFSWFLLLQQNAKISSQKTHKRQIWQTQTPQNHM